MSLSEEEQNHMRGPGSGAHLGQMEERGGSSGMYVSQHWKWLSSTNKPNLQGRNIEGRRRFQFLNYVTKYTFVSKL